MPARCCLAIAIVFWAVSAGAEDPPPLAGTAPLEWQGDLAARMLDGIDRFLLAELDRSVSGREARWQRNFTSPERYIASLAPNRQRLAQILGVRDPRTSAGFSVGDGNPAPICWPSIGDVVADGWYFAPRDTDASHPCIIVLPDCADADQATARAVAGRLAASGCAVIVPKLVDRSVHRHRNANLTQREFLYRSAFELGRHIIGYEVQSILAAVDNALDKPAPLGKISKVGVLGYGEGGLLALAAGALDPRIAAVAVCGYFGSRQAVWQEPLDRNVFGLLREFGDAELASMIAPRPLVIEASRGPELVLPPGTGGGPGRLVSPPLAEVRAEVERARQLTAGLKPPAPIALVGENSSSPFAPATLAALLDALDSKAGLADAPPDATAAIGPRRFPALDMVYQFSRHNQQLLAKAEQARKQYWAKLDTSSLAKFEQTIEPYRTAFYDEAIGRFDQRLLPANPRTRGFLRTARLDGYEVVLDVFDEVFAYGILLLPRDLKPGQRRPVVVCQHGLEGRPTDTLAGGHKAYAGFATALAERGYIVFAPQNPYLLGDRFRTLQRKANPLGKTLFSIIVPQHQQIVDWLGTLPFVDAKKIAFYGLSYGGKTAMRVPALVKNYCLSICSGDFNNWVWKNASIDNQYTYVNTGEYEIFEFDLGSSFNYAEMASLVAPRPFMVERGHFDGVAPDEQVAYEYAKVRFLYEARLGIGDRTELEWFSGPHQVHGQGTYRFLDRWLK